MRRWLFLLLTVSFILPGVIAQAQNASVPASKSAAGQPAKAVDKAYLQSLWDGWASADLEKQGQFYAQGPNHLFFDVAPLKYDSWEAYKAGVAPSIKDAPKVTYTLDDDLQIHPDGNITWVAGTLKMQGTSPETSKESLPLRWTAIFQLQNGRWVIEHEHISVPAEIPQQ